MHTLYNILLLPLRWLASLAKFRFRRDGDRSEEWDERRARSLPAVRPGALWIHGSSVGEARIVGAIASGIRAERPELPLAASAYTRTGRNALPDRPDVDAAFFMPLDFPGYPARLLEAIHPSALVLVETELWPNLIREAEMRAVPAVVVNGRLSPSRMKRYRRFESLYGPLIRSLAAIGAQSGDDAERFLEFGVDRERIQVTGNMKYDLPAPSIDRKRLAARFGLSHERPVLVAGSTGHGEEQEVLKAFREIRKDRKDAFLVLAPRHVDRSETVHRLASAAGLDLRRISGADNDLAGRADGILVDTLGELVSLYGLATAAFVGGSLVPVGGHNVLEPAAAGVPVLYGPHTDHFREPVQALQEAGGGTMVENAEALARVFLSYLEHPASGLSAGNAAGQVVKANRGALARSIDLVLEAVKP
jgi:3-deoxy-D-manno-octulosonic-acid transferase